MRPRMFWPWLVLLFGFFLYRPSPASWGGTPPPNVAESATETLVATVRSLDSEAGTLELLTGCGHALRTVRIWVAPETRITRKGAGAGFSDLKPGTMIRVQFQRGEDRNLARAIVVEASGGGR